MNCVLRCMFRCVQSFVQFVVFCTLTFCTMTLRAPDIPCSKQRMLPPSPCSPPLLLARAVCARVCVCARVRGWVLCWVVAVGGSRRANQRGALSIILTVLWFGCVPNRATECVSFPLLGVRSRGAFSGPEDIYG